MGRFLTQSGLVLPDSCRPPVVAKLNGLYIFARNGRICMERIEKTGTDADLKSCTVQSAKHRVKSLGEQLKYTRSVTGHDRRSAKVLEDFLHAFEAAIKQAEEQGPFEYADMRRHRVRAAPVSVPVTKDFKVE